MEAKDLIPANEFCTQHNIEFSFVSMLHENGLIEITTVEETCFIPAESLSTLEKMIRLHYELDINLPGIEAITHLLDRIENMQNELMALRNRLRRYEVGG